jgi:photosystem II stability/assembly factor-like uncharacterized protein
MEVPMRRRILAAASALAIVVLAASGAAAVTTPPVPVSGPTPFAPNCNGAPQPGTLYPNSEVEPWVNANPKQPANMVAVWQQDRWSNGGAQGNLTGVTFDAGRSWDVVDSPPPFSRCAGGNAQNGGDYERATDPWVSFSPNGTAYQMALSIDVSTGDPNLLNVRDAMLVSTSKDGGRTWGKITTLIADDSPLRLNDKNTLTADPTDSRFAYAVWDRLELTEDLQSFRGPTLFTRTTDGGQTWERPRVIFDPGLNNQTIANQIAVLPNGRLVNLFNWIIQGQLNVGVMFSDDKGRTWTEPRLLNALGTIGITDPFDGALVRTGDLVPDIAIDPRKGTRTIYVVWQDARFAEGLRDQIALVRSSDGGKTWTTPRRVSSNLDTQAFTASVEVNDRGHVGVSYYDFTRDSPTAQPLLTDHWLTVSADKGAHFSTRERQTASSFDMRLAPLTGTGFFVGDYVGLDGVARRFHPVFAVTRSTANPVDIVSTIARPPFGPSVAALQADGTAAARTATARSSSRLGFVTSH